MDGCHVVVVVVVIVERAAVQQQSAALSIPPSLPHSGLLFIAGVHD